MKTKTLSLIAVLASMLVTGCGNDGSSSNNGSNNSGTHNNNVVPAPDGYTSVLSSKVGEARGVPSDMGLEAVKNYNSAFSTNPNTFDYLANNKQTNSEYYANFVDNLLEHDQYGHIRGALAEGAYYNEGDKYFEAYTKLRFKLRKGVKWVDAGGNEYAEVKADDFKAGLQHLLDAKGGAETLAYYISGAKAYADGEDTNFNNVGFYQINDYEFEYILEKPCPFFHTFFEYTSFLPLNRDFFISMGGAFGTEWDSNSCDFGKVGRTDTILYCGPYILSTFTENKELKMKKNTKYWDIGNVQIDNVNYVYTSGQDVQGLVNMFNENKLSSLGVNNQNYAAISEAYPDSMYKQGVGTTTYYFNWNLNRSNYSVGDCVSGKVDDNTAKENTKKAILNENFRKAVFSAIPKIQMNALADDNNTATVSVRNTYTTPEFVSTTEEATTSTGVKHPSSYYYEMVNREMEKINEVNGDDYARYASEWDPEQGVESSSDENESTFKDQENSYYNEETAKILKNKAKTELEKQGVTFPIHIDYLTYAASDIFLGQAQLLKSRVEKVLGSDFITINIQQTSNENNYQNSHFMAASGSRMNFDLSSGTGWGPDYGDPATFLNTLAWEGDLQSNLGFEDNAVDKAKYYEVLGDYMKLFDEASAVTDPNKTSERYAKLAAAEAELLSSAVIMPNTTDGGGYAVSRIVPRTNQRTFYGTDDSRFKYMVVVDQVLTNTQRDQIIADWEEDLSNI